MRESILAITRMLKLYTSYHVRLVLIIWANELRITSDFLSDSKVPNNNACMHPFNHFFFFFLAALGLCCCTRAFSSCGEWGLLFVAVHGRLIAVASLVVEHGL